MVFELYRRYWEWGSTIGIKFISTSNEDIFWFALPHIPKNLYVACDLLLRSLDTMLMKIID